MSKTTADNTMHPLTGAVDRVSVSVRVADLELAATGAGDGASASDDTGAHPDASVSFGDAAGGEDGAVFSERFSVEHADGQLQIEEAQGDWPAGTLRVSVPESTLAARLRARAGAITVTGVDGEVAARTRNGAIRTERCRGDLNLMCANGSIEVADCVTPRIELAASNGRVTVANTEIGGGTVKTANGRIRIQLRPLATDDGASADVKRLTIYSALGGVSLAVPEDANTLFKIHSLGKVRNDLPVHSVQSSAGMTVMRTGDAQDGKRPLVVLIKSLKGGIELMRYLSFDANADDKRADDHEGDDEFFADDSHRHGVWFDVDFSEELPKFMHDVKRFGAKFGHLGEEISREMRNAFAFGRRHQHGTRGHESQEQRSASHEAEESRDTSPEVAAVLEMLKEGKITVEEAEKLIAAIRR